MYEHLQLCEIVIIEGILRNKKYEDEKLLKCLSKKCLHIPTSNTYATLYKIQTVTHRIHPNTNTQNTTQTSLWKTSSELGIPRNENQNTGSSSCPLSQCSNYMYTAHTTALHSSQAFQTYQYNVHTIYTNISNKQIHQLNTI